ncbi:hypothetical protein BKA57DRAFT_495175 [Linnemannia elongata]|nr:hypothetical protein BKA57DRAFT_495175 [Linnemannia elongata]
MVELGKGGSELTKGIFNHRPESSEQGIKGSLILIQGLSIALTYGKTKVANIQGVLFLQELGYMLWVSTIEANAVHLMNPFGHTHVNQHGTIVVFLT